MPVRAMQVRGYCNQGNPLGASLEKHRLPNGSGREPAGEREVGGVRGLHSPRLRSNERKLKMGARSARGRGSEGGAWSEATTSRASEGGGGAGCPPAAQRAALAERVRNEKRTSEAQMRWMTNEWSSSGCGYIAAGGSRISGSKRKWAGGAAGGWEWGPPICRCPPATGHNMRGC